MLEDTQTMRGDICCEATCVCHDLPDIAPRDIGLYLGALAEEETIAVAAYERHFGDLVFMRLGSNGSIQLLEFVDGFPQAESVAGAWTDRGVRSKPGLMSVVIPPRAVRR